MNTTPNDPESGQDALHALRSIQLPDGMQERITGHVRQRQLEIPARGLRKYTWELCIGTSIAVVMAAVLLCIFTLQTHRAGTQPVAVNVPVHRIVPAPAPTHAEQGEGPSRKAVPAYRVRKITPTAPMPQSPPELPLTAQERLLLTLASRPSLAASAAASQPVSDHGLGANSLFDLDHEQLTPMQAEPLESTPLPPAPSESIPSGENQ